VSDRALTLEVLADRLALCRFEPETPLPAWVFHAEARLWSVTRTPRELSVVCGEDDLPPSVTGARRGWRAMRVRGTLELSMTGVLHALTAPLAAAAVPVFAFSTFDTDYLLVPEPDLERAIEALRTVFEVEHAA
jgi:uncharacterized protein